MGQGRQSALPLAHPSNLNHLVIVTSSLAASKCNLRVGEGAAGSNRVARGCDSLVTRQQLSTTHVSTPQAGRRQHCHYWCHTEDEGVRECERVSVGVHVSVCTCLFVCVYGEREGGEVQAHPPSLPRPPTPLSSIDPHPPVFQLFDMMVTELRSTTPQHVILKR